ncbi:MAG: HEAT repeat domain-containing protein [Planctomycetota bacterium]
MRKGIGEWRVLSLSVLLLCGCSSLPTWVPFTRETPDRLPGVLAPHEKIATLRQLAEGAPSKGADERERLIDELLQALPQEKDPMIRSEIITTLAAYPGDRVDAVLSRALEDPDRDVQLATCAAWGRRGGPQACAALSRALQTSNDRDVRLAAARGLGDVRDPAAVAALGSVLEDRDPALQHRAVQSLRAATGEDFGNDVNAWRQYVRGETPRPRAPTSLAERFRTVF